jgi:autotransporter translocation and assembly factor TamB
VTGVVSGLIIGKVKDAIAPRLPIDVIKLDVGGQDYAGVTQTRVEVGKYIADNVYLSYVHQFGSSSGLKRVNSNEAHVEYRFLRRYELGTVFGDAGVGSIDFYWTYRY